MMVQIGLGAIAALLLGEQASAGAGPKVYTCQPSLSVFCRNIHVSCAGITTIRTARFIVSVSGDTATVRWHGVTTSRSGRVHSDNGLLIELAASRDWIRIEPDGRYAHRIYREGRSAMSYGYCR